MEKKLHRNEHDKVVAGVASGLADYMQIDVTVIRLLFILTTIFIPTSGLLVYIIIWIVVPVNNDLTVKYNQFNDYFKNDINNPSMFNSANSFNNPSNSAEQTKWNTPNTGPGFTNSGGMNDFNPQPKNTDTSRTIGGLVLLILGIYFLLKQFDILPEFFSIWKIYKLWPLAIVAIGISLIFKNQRKSEWDNFKKTTEEAQRAQAQKPVDVTAPIADETPAVSQNLDKEEDNSTTNNA